MGLGYQESQVCSKQVATWSLDFENLCNFDKIGVGVNALSWKCPGHVPDMSLGRGHVLKSQGQKGWPLPTL